MIHCAVALQSNVLPLHLRLLSLGYSDAISCQFLVLLFPLAEAQQVEDDRTKALSALGEQQNSSNDIRVSVHLGNL